MAIMTDTAPKRRYTGRPRINPDRPLTHAETQRRYMLKLRKQRDEFLRIQKKIQRLKTSTR